MVPPSVVIKDGMGGRRFARYFSWSAATERLVNTVFMQRCHGSTLRMPRVRLRSRHAAGALGGDNRLLREIDWVVYAKEPFAGPRLRHPIGPGIGAGSSETDESTIDMKPQPEPSTQEVLAGLVERVTYHNAENGFCVLRAKARGYRDDVTVVGHAATIASGEWITASGEWVNDRNHGQQFKARFLRTSLPDSVDGSF
jgi:hypothetical protein